MMGVLIIAVLVVAAVMFIKMNHFRHKLTIIALLLFALFLIKVYTGWLGNGFQNLKSLTGNAVRMDWTSTNGTFLSKELEQIKR